MIPGWWYKKYINTHPHIGIPKYIHTERERKRKNDEEKSESFSGTALYIQSLSSSSYKYNKQYTDTQIYNS